MVIIRLSFKISCPVLLPVCALPNPTCWQESLSQTWSCACPTGDSVWLSNVWTSSADFSPLWENYGTSSKKKCAHALIHTHTSHIQTYSKHISQTLHIISRVQGPPNMVDICHLFCLKQRLCAKSLQSCSILYNPMDCSPPGSSVHGILQAKTVEWVAIPSSRGSSWPRDWTRVSCICRPPGKANLFETKAACNQDWYIR